MTQEISDTPHPEYRRLLPIWTKVRDAAQGQDAIKDKGRLYLPDPDETGSKTDQAIYRYNRYLERAVYFNATGRTLSGLVGVAYATWPQIETSFSELLDDPDGSGVTLIGQSQWVLAQILQTGRAGLLANWPSDTGRKFKSLADQLNAGIRPFIEAFSAEQILTWETTGTVLTRVVLKTCKEQVEAGEIKIRPQLRELLMEGGAYVIRIWTQFSQKGKYLLENEFKTSLKFIPFSFIGAVNNDAWPDTPPLLDLANLNIAHYRNSADFEESSFIMGQPQLVVTGVDQEWKDAQGQIVFGARIALVLPNGADAKLLQVAPNTIAQEAMNSKSEMMQSLGARLLTAGEAPKTATQSAAETKASYSVLSLACDNVSHAYTRVLGWASSGYGKASFAIDTRFNDLTLDANAIRETVAAWQAGLVPQSDAWRVMRQLGVIDQSKTDAQIGGEIEAAGPPLKLDEAA